jgi:hypothetical protein
VKYIIYLAMAIWGASIIYSGYSCQTYAGNLRKCRDACVTECKKLKPDAVLEGDECRCQCSDAETFKVIRYSEKPDK